jgi:hypothetical protein
LGEPYIRAAGISVTVRGTDALAESSYPETGTRCVVLVALSVLDVTFTFSLSSASVFLPVSGVTGEKSMVKVQLVPMLSGVLVEQSSNADPFSGKSAG